MRNLTARPAGPPGFFSNSDDHLLKNIELFDKLSLRFNGRVLFIKDVIGDEICCWSFYGQGRKLAEVCCTSIVYATEKKQTKVGASLCVVGQDTHQGVKGASILLSVMVIGKDEKQYKGAQEWHETICSGQLGRGCWEGNSWCNGKDWVFGGGPVQV